MNTLDGKYQELLQDILDNGTFKKDRTGTGTISVFGRQLRHPMSQGFPLLTTKKMAWKTMVTELLWFLRGDTNIKYLLENNCHIWTGDAYNNYMKRIKKQYDDGGDYADIKQFEELILKDDDFAEEFGELGPIYGKQWRNWELRKTTREEKIVRPGIYSLYVDQIANLINDLRTNPDSRRLMVNSWNVGDIDKMVLPPCHYGFQVYTRKLTGEEMWDLLKKKVGEERFKSMVDDVVPFGGGLSEELEIYKIPKRSISLMWNQRSVDTFLGLPFNIASYGLLLEIIANEVGMVAGDLIANLGDVHLYSNHIEQAKEQIERTPFNLPKLKIEGIHPSIISKPRYWKPEDFTIEDYQSHPPIKAPLSN
jgi:thymidylate synthase